MQNNQASATEAANALAREQDPLNRAAQCNVFIAIACNTSSAYIPQRDAEMAQAAAAYRAFLERHIEGSPDQLLATTGAILLPAEAGARNRAARWCIENVAADIAVPAR